MSATPSRWSSPKSRRRGARRGRADRGRLRAAAGGGRNTHGARTRPARGVDRGAGQFVLRLGDRRRRRGRTGAAPAARHHVSLSLVNNRVVVNSMEPRGAIGEYDPGEDAYTLWSSTQGSHFCAICWPSSIFQIPENRIRVVTPDVGGGFGMKLFLYPEHVAGAVGGEKARPRGQMDARPLGRVHDRHAGPRQPHPARSRARRRAAVSRPRRSRSTANMGAYLSNFAPEIPTVRARSCTAASMRCRRSMSRSRASSPTPCRSMPIAAPAGRRRPMPSSG